MVADLWSDNLDLVFMVQGLEFLGLRFLVYGS
jgi:hypothetical protein